MKLFSVLTAASVLALASSAAVAGGSTLPTSGISVQALGTIGAANITAKGGNNGTWTTNNAGASGVADVPVLPGTSVTNNSTTSTTSFTGYVPVGGTTTPKPCTGTSSSSSSSSCGSTPSTGSTAGTGSPPLRSRVDNGRHYHLPRRSDRRHRYLQQRHYRPGTCGVGRRNGCYTANNQFVGPGNSGG